jgi:hypothetical protein
MNPSGGAVWFVGDLSDPWVAAIADACRQAPGLVEINCLGDLPDTSNAPSQPPRLIVIHCPRLTSADAERLKRFRDQGASSTAPAIILCIGPYVRYEELERWSALADVVLSEATAPDVLPRHVAKFAEADMRRAARNDTARFRVDVAGGNYDMCRVVVDACAGAGYRACQIDELEVRHDGPSPVSSSSFEPVLTIWDVPVLEPDWAERLERRARLCGPVIALFGFPDRTTVSLAKARGAIACLELPYNVDDLLDVIDRAGRSIPIESWPVAARAEPPHRLPPRPRGRKSKRDTPEVMPWSDRDAKPTIA